MSVQIIHSDAIEAMRSMTDASVDSVVTDPPYHLSEIKTNVGRGGFDLIMRDGRPAEQKAARAGFMGKTWDGGDIAFRVELWAEVCRVLKPGGYLVAFGSSRGHHRMFCAIEDAGLIIHPMLGWITGQGFPKAHKVEAEGWEGWRYGLQSLKPAIEPICLAQKPMSEKTGTANVLKHGTGALNIDATRIPGAPEPTRFDPSKHGHEGWRMDATGAECAERASPLGRWPANVVTDGSPEVLEAFARFEGGRRTSGNVNPTKQPIGFNGAPGRRAVPIDHQDTGTAARFFFSAKASREERQIGHIAGERNGHCTVKPLALMQWLVRLVTPPGGTVLDMFAGSGSTGIAADREQFNAILIESSAEYVEIARRRVIGDSPLFAEGRPA